MNNLLMWVGGGLAAALFALFAVPPFVDWNQYRGVFEEEVSRLLGREVRVGGRVSLRFFRFPTSVSRKYGSQTRLVFRAHS